MNDIFLELTLKVQIPKNSVPVTEGVKEIKGNYSLFTKIHNSRVFEGEVAFTIVDVEYQTEDGHTGLLGQVFLEGLNRHDEASELAAQYHALID